MQTASCLFIVSALVMQLSCAPRYYHGPVTDHFDGIRFNNPLKPLNKGFLEVLKWQWTRTPQPWPEYTDLPSTDQPPQRVTGNQLRVSYLGQPPTLPIHYGTFQLADTGYEAPLRDLKAAMETANVPAEQIRPRRAGSHWWVP